MTAHATAPSGAARSEFIPYVYGAALGRPSRGRPEKVLANPDRHETAVRLMDRVPSKAPGAGGPSVTKGCGSPAAVRRHYRAKEELCPACQAAEAEDKQRKTTRKREEKVGNGRIDGREGRVTARNAIPGGTSRNGLPVGGGYVYRGNDKDELTGKLGRARLELEAQAAISALAPADEARLAELEGELAARGVVASEKTMPKAPKPKQPQRAPAQQERQPDREEEPPASPAVLEPEPVSAPEPEPELAPVVPELAPVAQAAPAAPARRHRKCGYPIDSIGHKIACGAA